MAASTAGHDGVVIALPFKAIVRGVGRGSAVHVMFGGRGS